MGPVLAPAAAVTVTDTDGATTTTPPSDAEIAVVEKWDKDE